MDSRDITIQVATTILAVDIERAEEYVKLLKRNMERYQNHCRHEQVEIYRGHTVGACPKCKKPFLTKGQVDELWVHSVRRGDGRPAPRD